MKLTPDDQWALITLAGRPRNGGNRPGARMGPGGRPRERPGDPRAPHPRELGRALPVADVAIELEKLVWNRFRQLRIEPEAQLAANP